MAVQNIDLSADPNINLIPSFGNAYLRFGNSTGSFALNGSVGSLQGPQYSTDGGISWTRSTFNYQPMAVAIGIGGTGWNGGNRYFSRNQPGTNNTSGSSLYDRRNTSNSFTLDSNLSGGTGDFTWTGYFDLIDGATTVTLKIERKYKLSGSSQFLKEITKITNIDPENDQATNLRWWSGIQDDWVGTTDANDKLRGNISGGVFTPVSTVTSDRYDGASSRAVQTNAILVGSDYPGVGSNLSTPTSAQQSAPLQFFYSTDPAARSVISGTVGWTSTNGVHIVDPDSSESASNQTDGSYAVYLLLGNLTAGQSASFDTYFAVTPLSGLSAVLGAVDTEVRASSDTAAPTLASSTPADDATDIAIGADIVLNFSETVVAGTGDIILKKSDGTTVATIAVTDPQVSISGSTVTINPTNDLDYSTSYYVEIASGAFKDAANNNFAGITGDSILNFTTAAPPDTIAPTLASSTPADDATDIAIGADVVLNFSESVFAGTGDIILKKSDGTTVATIAVTDPQVSINGSTVTINPSSSLEYSTSYYVEIASGAFKDAANNNFAGISGGSALNFTTQAPITFGTGQYYENQASGAIVFAIDGFVDSPTTLRFKSSQTNKSEDGFYELGSLTNSRFEVLLTAEGAAQGSPSNDFETSPNVFVYLIQKEVAPGVWEDWREIQMNVLNFDESLVVSSGASGSGNEDTVITGTLVVSDADGLTNSNVFSISTVDQPSNGIASIDPTSGVWTYTPKANFDGDDSFLVTITDDAGFVVGQLITVTVLPQAEPTPPPVVRTSDETSGESEIAPKSDNIPVDPAPAGSNVQPTDDDGDGLREVVTAADGRFVDGNRDGIPDYEQTQVVGLRLINDGAAGSDYGALVVSPGVSLSNVTLTAPSVDGSFAVNTREGQILAATLPQGITPLLAGVVSFDISGIPLGGSTEATIWFPEGLSSSDGSAYIRFNYTTNRFEEFVDSAGKPLYTFVDSNGDGKSDAVKLTLVDGDPNWDGDGIANGKVVDPGLLISGDREFIGTSVKNTLSGNLLSNTINGKQGNDWLHGGLGSDVLIGGKGKDRYAYTSAEESTANQRDTVKFGKGDRFVFSAFDGDSTREGQQKLSYIESRAFSGVAGELRSSGSVLEADLNGDGMADFAINLSGKQQLAAANLVL